METKCSVHANIFYIMYQACRYCTGVFYPPFFIPFPSHKFHPTLTMKMYLHIMFNVQYTLDICTILSVRYVVHTYLHTYYQYVLHIKRHNIICMFIICRIFSCRNANKQQGKLIETDAYLPLYNTYNLQYTQNVGALIHKMQVNVHDIYHGADD